MINPFEDMTLDQVLADAFLNNGVKVDRTSEGLTIKVDIKGEIVIPLETLSDDFPMTGATVASLVKERVDLDVAELMQALALKYDALPSD